MWLTGPIKTENLYVHERLYMSIHFVHRSREGREGTHPNMTSMLPKLSRVGSSVKLVRRRWISSPECKRKLRWPQRKERKGEERNEEAGDGAQ